MQHPPEENGHTPGEAGNEIGSARVQGDVVQAGSVSGGIHFHSVQDEPQGTVIVPRQLPADVSSFVNRKQELRALTRLIDPPAGRGRKAPIGNPSYQNLLNALRDTCAA